MSAKERLDKLLVDRGLAGSRERARALILAGLVVVGDHAVDKAGINLMELARTWDLKHFWDRITEPYAKMTLFVWLCCWVIPFWVLLGQRPKKTPAILGSVSLVMLFGFWLERNVLIWPSVVKGDMMAWLGPIQIGIFLGFLGLFLAIVIFYSRVFPTIAVSSKE